MLYELDQSRHLTPAVQIRPEKKPVIQSCKSSAPLCAQSHFFHLLCTHADLVFTMAYGGELSAGTHLKTSKGQPFAGSNPTPRAINTDI